MSAAPYNQSDLHVFTGRGYCSYGHQWAWRLLGQCIVSTEQGVGLILGILAIFLWASSHIVIYRFLWKHARDGGRGNVAIFVFLHWCSDLLCCIGAVLAQQLSSQILFGMSAVVVNSLCCIYYVAMGTGMARDKNDNWKHEWSSRRIWRPEWCLYPLLLVVPGFTVALVYYHMTSATTRDVVDKPVSLDSVSVVWTLGYLMGGMGGIMHCSARLVDIFDSYTTVDTAPALTLAYIAGVFADVSYTSSIYTQNRTLWFFRHTLPWILPRLISAGIDIGILIQKCIQWRRRQVRMLCHDDADCLLCSAGDDDDDDGWDSSGSEDVVWMSLRPNVPAIPYHPFCVPRIQIISESDAGLSDNVDLPCPGGEECSTDQLLDLNEPCDAADTLAPLSCQSDADTTTTDDITEAGRTYSRPVDDDTIVHDTDTDENDTETDGDYSDKSDGVRQSVSTLCSMNSVSSEERIASWIQIHDDSFETTFPDDA